MTRAVEMVYEDKVLKPMERIDGLKEHDRVLAILSPLPTKKGLREIVGTLTHEEAEAMKKEIEEEFEKIEGDW